eukprot:SM000051S17585  [mRNA]  locus=s51:507828:525769:- [translate_table: standard]
MPTFMPDDELAAAAEAGDVAAVAMRADEFARAVVLQLESTRARADAAKIDAEQTCSLIEQKYMAVNSENAQLEQEKAQLAVALETRSTELAEARAAAHLLELEAMKKDGELQRAGVQLNELRRARKELLDLNGQKDQELEERNASIKSYLDKIVALTEQQASQQGSHLEEQAELLRAKTTLTRFQQEVDLLKQHNAWLNDELSSKSEALLRDRRKAADVEAGLQSKLAEAESQVKELTAANVRAKERIHDLEGLLGQLRQELKFANEEASSQEGQYSAEIVLAKKLADLYKASAEDANNKATELEGVVKAMEVHIKQLEELPQQLQSEKERNEALQKANIGWESARQQLEEELAGAKEALAKAQVVDEGNMQLALAGHRDTRERFVEPLDMQLAVVLHGSTNVPPQLPQYVSGTALAASLLRDGWSLSTMYEKYQEAADAWRHERQARQHAEVILERVRIEIEKRAEFLTQERDEHAQVLVAYSVIEGKLKEAAEERLSMRTRIRDCMADLRKKDRDIKSLEKEVADLQNQVTVLLKEGTDKDGRLLDTEGAEAPSTPPHNDESGSDAIITERLVNVKDIHSLVEHNTQLRTLARTLAREIEEKEVELKEKYAEELEKRSEENMARIEQLLEQFREQSRIVNAVQGQASMFKRLYQEELQARTSIGTLQRVQYTSTLQEARSEESPNFKELFEKAQEELKSMREDTSQHLKDLQREVDKAREEASSARMERARSDGEAKYAREQHEAMLRSLDEQRLEMEGVLRRNMGFAQTITDYQKRIRDSAEAVQAAEEASRRLSIEVSVLEKEKDLLASVERRASEEVSSLSQKVHHLQAMLDSKLEADDAKEATRRAEKAKAEDELRRLQREWADSKRELEQERSHTRDILAARDAAVRESSLRVEGALKEVEEARNAANAAETKSQILQAKVEQLETNLQKADEKLTLVLKGDKGPGDSPSVGRLPEREAEASGSSDGYHSKLLVGAALQARDELERAKEDLEATKSHLDQYKRISVANEEALNSMSKAHEQFKQEANQFKENSEAELVALRGHIDELEADLTSHSQAKATRKEEEKAALMRAEAQQSEVRSTLESTIKELDETRTQLETMKKDVEHHHQRWREAQNNYEQQVLRQGDTIRELTTVSEQLLAARQELAAVRGRAETAEAELDAAKVANEAAADISGQELAELRKKVDELEKQNKVLLDRLGALQVSSAEVGGTVDRERGDTDMQEVIRYLRRSKETVEAELALLKQERGRLLKQLDAAEHAAEEAQAQLRAEQEKLRGSLHTADEFQNLKSQAEQVNLLRESNAMLREENRRSFEDSRTWREKLRKLQDEQAPLHAKVREKQVELEASGKEIETYKAEAHRWQTRVNQLLEKYKAVDLDEYQRVQSELDESKRAIQSKDEEIDALKKKMADTEEELKKRTASETRVKELEHNLQEQRSRATKLDEELVTARHEKRRIEVLAARHKARAEQVSKEKDEGREKGHEQLLKERDALRSEKENAKKEFEKEREVALKAKEDMTKERESLLKQVQDLKAAIERGNYAAGNSEASSKAKEQKLQTLERLLNEEKQKRKRDTKDFTGLADRATQKHQDVLAQVEVLRAELNNLRSKPDGNSKPLGELPAEVALAKASESYTTSISDLQQAGAAHGEGEAAKAGTGPSNPEDGSATGVPQQQAPAGLPPVAAAAPSSEHPNQPAAAATAAMPNTAAAATTSPAKAVMPPAAPIPAHAPAATEVRQISGTGSTIPTTGSGTLRPTGAGGRGRAVPAGRGVLGAGSLRRPPFSQPTKGAAGGRAGGRGVAKDDLTERAAFMEAQLRQMLLSGQQQRGSPAAPEVAAAAGATAVAKDPSPEGERRAEGDEKAEEVKLEGGAEREGHGEEGEIKEEKEAEEGARRTLRRFVRPMIGTAPAPPAAPTISRPLPVTTKAPDQMQAPPARVTTAAATTTAAQVESGRDPTTEAQGTPIEVVSGEPQSAALAPAPEPTKSAIASGLGSEIVLLGKRPVPEAEGDTSPAASADAAPPEGGGPPAPKRVREVSAAQTADLQEPEAGISNGAPAAAPAAAEPGKDLDAEVGNAAAADASTELVGVLVETITVTPMSIAIEEEVILDDVADAAAVEAEAIEEEEQQTLDVGEAEEQVAKRPRTEEAETVPEKHEETDMMQVVEDVPGADAEEGEIEVAPEIPVTDAQATGLVVEAAANAEDQQLETGEVAVGEVGHDAGMPEAEAPALPSAQDNEVAMEEAGEQPEEATAAAVTAEPAADAEAPINVVNEATAPTSQVEGAPVVDGTSSKEGVNAQAKDVAAEAQQLNPASAGTDAPSEPVPPQDSPVRITRRATAAARGRGRLSVGKEPQKAGDGLLPAPGMGAASTGSSVQERASQGAALQLLASGGLSTPAVGFPCRGGKVSPPGRGAVPPSPGTRSGRGKAGAAQKLMKAVKETRVGHAARGGGTARGGRLISLQGAPSRGVPPPPASTDAPADSTNEKEPDGQGL